MMEIFQIVKKHQMNFRGLNIIASLLIQRMDMDLQIIINLKIQDIQIILIVLKIKMNKYLPIK